MSFIGMDIDDQRKLLSSREKSKKKQCEVYIRGMCDIIKNIVSDVKLVKYFILLLDGIVEGIAVQRSLDDHERLSLLINLQKATKDKEDIIDMLKQYSHSPYNDSYLVGPQSGDQVAKDVAAHVFAKLLVSKELKGTDEEMKNFLNYMLKAQTDKVDSEKPITSLGFSAALMHLLKSNDILRYFISSNGLQT